MADGRIAPGAVATDTPDAAPTDEARIRERVWSRVQLARNVRRPHTLELLGLMAEDVIELHGDRLFSDDEALVGGFATLAGQRVVFVGHQKGAEVEENIRRNFGMPHPDGYRKAMRLMRLAERLGLPVVTFVDTPGASPDAPSEERGQAEAIASSIALMTGLRVPIVTIITGEGGSGGALAIAVGDVVLALENAIYSVISPEGCASILWRTPDAAQQAAVAMRLTAGDQLALGVVDEVVAEPAAGAHEDPERTAMALREALVRHLERLLERDPESLVEARYRRYRQIGTVKLVGPTPRPTRARKGVGDRLRELLGPARTPRREGEPGSPAVHARAGTPGTPATPATSGTPGDRADGAGQPPLHEEI